MTRTKRNLLIAVLLVLAAALAFWLIARPSGDAPAGGGDAAKAPDPAAPRPALAVTVASPEPAELSVTLAANGNIAAWQEASIGSESSGLKLAEVRVNVGDVVKKGQVLAVFTGDTVRADVAQAQASLAEAEAQAADAAANAERARTLEKTGALSQQQINQYVTTAQTAQARVQAARAVVSAQQVRSRNTQVLAPDDGVISARGATVGSVVNAGTELFRLVRQGRLEWRAEVTSAELSRIAPGTPAVVTAASGEQVRGTVRTVAPTVDPQTRNALVYVDLPGALQKTGASAARPPEGASTPSGGGAGREAPSLGAIKAGMFARGDFELGRSSAPTVPQSAIVPRDGFNNLFLLKDDSRVSQLKVQTGRRVGDRVEITSALPQGARMVVQGAGFLNDGDLVKVVDAPARAPAASASAPAAPPAGNGK